MDFYWDVTVDVYGWISENYDTYQQHIEILDQAPINTAFHFCSGDSDSASAEGITACSAKIAHWAEMSEQTQNYMYRFGQKYWHLIDRDGNGSLDFNEFRDVWVGLAAIDSQANLNLFDYNENNILDANEIADWKDQGTVNTMIHYCFTEAY